ncbi:MAG: nucleotide exchange factor GrpE [Patescibacteria group bacterium]
MKQPKSQPPFQPQDDVQQVDETLETQQAETVSEEYANSLEGLQNQSQEFEEKYKRVLADYRNLEQRMTTDRVQYMKMANRWLIEALLEPLDFMEKATEHIADKGLRMVVDRFYQVLGEEGLTEIEVVGKPFDEKTMEAVDTAEGEENKVMKVVSKGFRLHDQVIRHAKVVVGKEKNN